MRICSYVTPEGDASYGTISDGTLRDAGDGLRDRYPNLRSALAAGALEKVRAAAEAGRQIDPAVVRLLPPVPNPDKVLCIGLNYMTHILETGRDKPSHPSVFTRYPSSIVGHGNPLICPRASGWFDFEGELAVVIGRAGRDIAAGEAMSHVAGYSCFNDGSVRDFQRHTSQFWAGKNFVSSGAMGPWIVTADEIADIGAQSLETRLNGTVVQSTSVGDMAFGVPELIAYLSIVTELLPGDIIATGTPSGVGIFREPKLFMKDGDVVEVEISGLGCLSNPVRNQD